MAFRNVTFWAEEILEKSFLLIFPLWVVCKFAQQVEFIFVYFFIMSWV